MNWTSPSFILCVIALILSVISFIWPLPWGASDPNFNRGNHPSRMKALKK